jgi:hypothetical protein
MAAAGIDSRNPDDTSKKKKGGAVARPSSQPARRYGIVTVCEAVNALVPHVFTAATLKV